VPFDGVAAKGTLSQDPSGVRRAPYSLSAVRIPGGDLVPARRRRRYGGTYGRRRNRNRRAVVLGAALVLLAAGAAWYLRKDDSGVPARLAVEPTCSPTPTATVAPVAPPRVVALPQPPAVTMSVLNGTNHSLLAKHVADALAAQGFHITGQGNSRTPLAGASQVVYGPGATLLARTAALWVPGSVVAPNPRAPRGSVQLVLGSSFTRLATPAEAAAARRGPVPTPSAAPSPTQTVLPCRS